MCVCLCVRVHMCVCPAVLSLLALSRDSLTVFGEALIDEEPPPRRVLSEHEGLAAGSTNPGAPNSAICPAMCSHLPAGSTLCCACLTHWQCDCDCAATDWDQYFNESGRVNISAGLSVSDLFSSVGWPCTDTVGVDGLIPVMLKIYVTLMCFG